MDELRRLMDFDSLWTLWFWIAHVMTWSLSSHFALGVPFDMVVQANRERQENGPWATHCEAMIRASAFRLVAVFDSVGLLVVGVWSFLLASLATFALLYQNEFSIALLTFFLPLTLVYALTVQRARTIERQGLSGQRLRDAVRGLRFWVQVCGALGIVLAGAAAVWEDVRTVTPISF